MKGRAEGVKLRKKMETDISELELQVDLLTKNNAELNKNSKKMQQQMKVRLKASAAVRLHSCAAL